ncbi:MAG: glucosaminidase domain-containing protein, partial [Oscillospiraceae bacterium]
MKKTIMTCTLPFLSLGMLVEMNCIKGVAIQNVCSYYDEKLLKAETEKVQESLESGLLLLRKKGKEIFSEKKKSKSSKKAKNIDGLTVQNTQASDFLELSAEDVVKNIGALFTADQKKTGILASVSMAQFIFESGYGRSELAQNANNLFGMKCSLSGNDWAGSTWNGTNKYIKKTQ